MGELIMAGFIDGTRIFSHNGVPGTVGLLDHQPIYFFNLIQAGQYPRPQSNAYRGGVFTWPWQSPPGPTDYAVYAWWDHVQNGPDRELGDFTHASFVSPVNGFPAITDRTFFWTQSMGLSRPYPDWMRNLVCDFSPHLLPDVHPFWPLYVRHGTLNLIEGAYAANPWHNQPSPPAPGTRDNPSLYHNLGGAKHGAVGSNTLGYEWTAVGDGHVNPPGTFSQTNQYILGPTSLFGPFSPCTGGGGSGTDYLIGSWGYGAANTGCPDKVPGDPNFPGFGLRVSCELSPGVSTHSNLQTFLVIPEHEVPAGASAPETGMPSKAKMDALIRKADEIKRRGRR